MTGFAFWLLQFLFISFSLLPASSWDLLRHSAHSPYLCNVANTLIPQIGKLNTFLLSPVRMGQIGYHNNELNFHFKCDWNRFWKCMKVNFGNKTYYKVFLTRKENSKLKKKKWEKIRHEITFDPSMPSGWRLNKAIKKRSENRLTFRHTHLSKLSQNLQRNTKYIEHLFDSRLKIFLFRLLLSVLPQHRTPLALPNLITTKLKEWAKN